MTNTNTITKNHASLPEQAVQIRQQDKVVFLLTDFFSFPHSTQELEETLDRVFFPNNLWGSGS